MQSRDNENDEDCHEPTADYDPQGNSILERTHQVVGNCLRTFELEKRDLAGPNPYEPFLTAAACAMRSTCHATLKHAPGQLVFGRDMMLPVNCKVDWALVALRKQEMTNKSNKQENKKRKEHACEVGDKILLHEPGMLPKMVAPKEGPHAMHKVHNNGTITINKGTAVAQTANVRRATPCFD